MTQNHSLFNDGPVQIRCDVKCLVPFKSSVLRWGKKGLFFINWQHWDSHIITINIIIMITLEFKIYFCPFEQLKM